MELEFEARRSGPRSPSSHHYIMLLIFKNLECSDEHRGLCSNWFHKYVSRTCSVLDFSWNADGLRMLRLATVSCGPAVTALFWGAHPKRLDLFTRLPAWALAVVSHMCHCPHEAQARELDHDRNIKQTGSNKHRKQARGHELSSAKFSGRSRERMPRTRRRLLGIYWVE